MFLTIYIVSLVLAGILMLFANAIKVTESTFGLLDLICLVCPYVNTIFVAIIMFILVVGKLMR